jgi:4-carboxymuconolactone decarboxylase
VTRSDDPTREWSDEVRYSFLQGVDRAPAEIRQAWAKYMSETVLDGMWARPVLSRRDRSLITVAALAALRCPTALNTQLEVALQSGVSAETLGEVILQVGGYAGLGIAEEAMVALTTVLGRDGSEHNDGPEPEGVYPGDRFARGREILATLRPDLADRPGPPPHPFAPEWSGWLTETAFGDLWSRSGLTLIERERVTLAVVIALGRETEVRSHLGIASNLGISPNELGEEIMHLAVYAGFPAAVDAMRLAADVLSRNDT